MGNVDYSYNNGSIKIKISGRRIQQNLVRAQKYLDRAVINDTNKYVPYRSGVLRLSAKNNTVIGSGEVKWCTPYAHYQHEGTVYVDSVTGVAAFYIEGVGFRSRKDVPKVPSNRALRYYTPGTGAHFFEKAKRIHGKTWVKKVKKIAGGR